MIDRNVKLQGNKIFSLAEPKNPDGAANKKYVDENITKRIEEEKDKVLPQDPATKIYLDEAIKNLAGGDVLVSKEGVFLKENGHYRATESLDIDNNKIENLPEPKKGSDAATKKYVDDVAKTLTLEKALIKENGGYNVANAYINMNFNNIKNIGEPGHISDAATKGYVDETVDQFELKYLI